MACSVNAGLPRLVFIVTDPNLVGSFIVDKKVHEPGPVVAVLVQVLHGGLEAGLQAWSMAFEKPHDQAPDERRLDGEGLLPYGCSHWVFIKLQLVVCNVCQSG